MPGIIDQIGPATLEKMKAIKARIEKCGHDLGIPDDDLQFAAKIVEIESVQRLADKMDAWQADAARWREEQEVKEKKKFDWGRAIVNTLAGFVGDYNARNKK